MGKNKYHKGEFINALCMALNLISIANAYGMVCAQIGSYREAYVRHE